MTIQYYPNAIKVTLAISTPAHTGITPRVIATLKNDVSTVSITVALADPIAAVIAWLTDRTITVTAVLHSADTWYLATTFEGSLTILCMLPLLLNTNLSLRPA
jgi:hypothetical protein